MEKLEEFGEETERVFGEFEGEKRKRGAAGVTAIIISIGVSLALPRVRPPLADPYFINLITFSGLDPIDCRAGMNTRKTILSDPIKFLKI